MKKFYWMLVWIAICAALQAQTLTPEVFASGGTQLSGTNGQIEYTVGEVVTATLTSNSDVLTQGFNQPEIVIVAVEEWQPSYTIQCYPNPTEQFVKVRADSDDELHVQVIDALGQVVIANQRFQKEIVLDVQAMANGTYIVSVARLDGEPLKNFTLFKRSTH